MKKKLYCVEVVSKYSGKTAMFFYVRATSLQDATVYAADYLVPDALEMKQVNVCNYNDHEIYSEIYNAEDRRF